MLLCFNHWWEVLPIPESTSADEGSSVTRDVSTAEQTVIVSSTVNVATEAKPEVKGQ